jgi:hypothetical protein
MDVGTSADSTRWHGSHMIAPPTTVVSGFQQQAPWRLFHALAKVEPIADINFQKLAIKFTKHVYH